MRTPRIVEARILSKDVIQVGKAEVQEVTQTFTLDAPILEDAWDRGATDR